jgi:predicted nucleotidyltransferase
MIEKKINNKTIKQLLSIIISIANPDKVILFGSHARGNAHKESDYDFIILKHNIKNEREITRPIYRELCEKSIPVSVDLIACSFKKWEKNLNKNYMIYKKAHEEGIVLYG